MMRMSGAVLSCCGVLFLALASVSAVQKLKSINDLKKINFGQSVPKHTLLLLYWFANEVNINNNNVIRLTFDPSNGDYGSHHYGNFEQLLDPVPYGYAYYTVGNLHDDRQDQLPDYVVNSLSFPPEYEGGNLDRIIFRVRHQNRRRSMQTDQVYITQHYDTSEHLGTMYDPEHTYQVTTNLLMQIREFSEDSLWDLRNRYGSTANNYQLEQFKNTLGELACLGLLLFIVVQEKHSSPKQNKRPRKNKGRNTQPDFVVNIPENTFRTHPRPNQMESHGWQNNISTLFYLHEQRDETQLTVTTGKNGKARILWKNVTEDRLNNEVMVVLFKNNQDQEASRTYRCIGDSKSGSWDTSVLLNDGLQARLHKVRRWWCFWTAVGEEISRGHEFKNPGADNAVNINGYDAHIQLFVKDGKACARLFVMNTFTNWKLEFNKSWVGFYASADKATNQYEFWQWQWATEFTPSPYYQDYNFDVYEYHSTMAIGPGVQARFIDRWEVKACTPSWGG